MSGFFDNMYRLYGEGGFDPYSDPGMEAGGMEQVQLPEEPQDPLAPPPTMTPRMVPPNFPRPGMEAYREHIRNAPVNKPSVLETIMAGIGGFATAWGQRDPGAGLTTTQQLLNTPYERALQEWKAKGTELEKVAQEEGDYLGNAMDYSTEGGKLDARYAELDARKDQINKNYEIAMKNATTAEAKVQAQKDRDASMNKILEERNNIDRMEAGTNKFEAETGRRRADAYGRYVDQYSAGAGKVGDVTPKVDDLMKAEQDALVEILASDPAARKFFTYNQETGSVDPVMEDWSSDDLYEREALMGRVGVAAQKRLGGESVGGIPHLWKMRPPVTVPPNRRRY